VCSRRGQSAGVPGPRLARTSGDTTFERDPRLLDHLPVIETDLGRLPEDIERELFDGFQLQVRYHQPTRRVTLWVTIDGEAIPRLTAASQAIMQRTGPPSPETQKNPDGKGRRGSLAGRAPAGLPEHGKRP
jgi:hypothetical protein